jgi:hypothetical protein
LKESLRRYGWLRKTISPLFFLLHFFVALPLLAAQVQATDPPYLSTVLELARQKELYKERYWHILLHYKRGLFGTRSLIDDEAFFLSKEGKRNPEAELNATIRAFFQNADDQSNPPVCKFIARYTWLKEQLDLDSSQLPLPECKRFTELIDQIKPESVSLIFPTTYVNSPASMFGHTLLIVETASKSKLLAYAINYSAVTQETFGPLFAIKGLFGYYKGYYSILPYYAKIQEYRDVNDRDIWEYPLNLEYEEVIRLLMHTYELNLIYSDYYFFDENCSYQLLFLLDAARPSLGLTDQFNLWVIPVDTVRAAKKNGLITGTFYRPSKSTKIKHIASLLPKAGRSKALSIVRGELKPEILLEQDIPKEEKIRICDLASEYLQYLYAKDEVTQQKYTNLFLGILQARSKLGAMDENEYHIRRPTPPDEGHLSNRLSLGFGIKERDLFQEIEYRAAYHDLNDNDKGYKEGAQIIFGNVALRYYFPDSKLQLQSLDLIDIVSIAPRDEFFQNISWKVRTGWYRRILADHRDHLLYRLNPGGGFAYEDQWKGLWYVFMESDLNLGPALEDNYAVGIGGSAGFIGKITDRWKIHAFVRDIYYGLGDTTNSLELALLQNFTITTNTSLTAKISRNRSHGTHQNEASLNFRWFF